MVEDETRGGRRIAELLSSEIHGHERGPLGRVSVADADPDVEPSAFGTFAYAIDLETGAGSVRDHGDDADTGETATERFAEAHVHPDRVHLEFRAGQESAVEAGGAAGLRVRPKAVEPPRTLVFVENGAEVKPALRVVRAVAAEVLDDAG